MGCIVSDMLWGTKMPLPRSDDRSKGQSSTAESIGNYIDAKLAVYKAASRKAARRRDYGAELKRLNCEPLVYQKNVWRYFDCADDDCVECWLNVGHEVQRPGRGVTKDEMQP